MQELLKAWLELPVPWIFASLSVFYFGSAALMVWLSFRSRLSPRIRSFKGVVAPFFTSTAIIFGLLVGFLSNDIWERNSLAHMFHAVSDFGTIAPDRVLVRDVTEVAG